MRGLKLNWKALAGLFFAMTGLLFPLSSHSQRQHQNSSGVPALTGGVTFQSQLQSQMALKSCTAGKVISGFDSLGNPICVDLPVSGGGGGGDSNSCLTNSGLLKAYAGVGISHAPYTFLNYYSVSISVNAAGDTLSCYGNSPGTTSSVATLTSSGVTQGYAGFAKIAVSGTEISCTATCYLGQCMGDVETYGTITLPKWGDDMIAGKYGVMSPYGGFVSASLPGGSVSGKCFPPKPCPTPSTEAQLKAYLTGATAMIPAGNENFINGVAGMQITVGADGWAYANGYKYFQLVPGGTGTDAYNGAISFYASTGGIHVSNGKNHSWSSVPKQLTWCN